jgi:hypothetical protein
VQKDCSKLKALQELADDSSSRSSSGSRRSSSSTRSSSRRKETAKKLEKHVKKQFANYSKELAALKEESNISSNESVEPGLSFCIIGATLKQAIKTGVLDDLDLWTGTLFDTQSTDDVFCNKKYLRNDWCYYREHTAALSEQREVLGRVLGTARGEGNEMCQSTG